MSECQRDCNYIQVIFKIHDLLLGWDKEAFRENDIKYLTQISDIVRGII